METESRITEYLIPPETVFMGSSPIRSAIYDNFTFFCHFLPSCRNLNEIRHIRRLKIELRRKKFSKFIVAHEFLFDTLSPRLKYEQL